MKLLFLDNLIAEELIRALCLAFMHSLWQGLFIAILAWVSLQLTRKSRPAFRYNMLAGYFILFICAVVYTFLYQYGSAAVSTGGSAVVNGVRAAGEGSSSMFISIAAWCNANALWLVATWFIIFLLKCAQMVRSLSALDHIRNFYSTEVSPGWRQRLQELAASLHLKTAVGFKESPAVSQPFVIGFLKPVILIPIGLLTHLPPDQAEAILLHELAHIKRRDYLVNLIQSFAETVFFFNPAVYILSAFIRTEREYCCDAIAVRQSGNKKTFINALITFHEYRSTSPYAMALAGRKGLLPARVYRIINGKNRNLSGLEKFSFAVCFSIMCMLLLSFSVMKEKKENNQQVLRPASEIQYYQVSDTKKKQEPRMETRRSKPQRVNIRVIAKDSIPANASTEFIAGYKAAMNYTLGTTADDKKRIDAEVELMMAKKHYPSAGAAKTRANLEEEMLKKRELEKLLRSRQ